MPLPAWLIPAIISAMGVGVEAFGGKGKKMEYEPQMTPQEQKARGELLKLFQSKMGQGATPYTGPLTAPVNPMSLMAMNMMSSMYGGKPYSQPSFGTFEQYMPRQQPQLPWSSQQGKRTAFARGGLVTQPTNALLGEAGPEMVVPLRKNMGMSPIMPGQGNPWQNMLGQMGGQQGFGSQPQPIGQPNPFQNLVGQMGMGGQPSPMQPGGQFGNMLQGLQGGMGNPFQQMNPQMMQQMWPLIQRMMGGGGQAQPMMRQPSQSMMRQPGYLQR